jgi:hypothetical protein
MKKLIISSLAIFALINCSSDDDAAEGNPVVDPTTIVPTKFTEITQDNQTYVTEYKYDGTKLLEETSSNQKTVYTYNGDLISKTEDYTGTKLTYKREFAYTNGKVTAETTTSYNTTLPLVTTIAFQYLSDNHVKFTRNGEGNDIYLSNNGNVKTAIWSPGSVIRTFNNTYDGQNNPYKNIKGYLKINFLLSLEGDYASNNLVSSSSVQTGSVAATYGSSGVHTYNDHDFPTKSVMTFTSSLHATNSHTYMYEYNK